MMHPSFGQEKWQYFKLASGARYPQSRCSMMKDKVFGRKRGQWVTERANCVIVTGQILAKMNR